MTVEAGCCGAVTSSGAPCRRRTSSGRCGDHADAIPAAPAGLTANAEALWTSVLKDYELEDHELALLREACRTLTTCERLEAVVDEQGLTTTGSKGQTVLHPAVQEARQSRLAFGKLVAQLRLPEGEQDTEAPARPSRAGADGRPQRRSGSRGPYGPHRRAGRVPAGGGS